MASHWVNNYLQPRLFRSVSISTEWRQRRPCMTEERSGRQRSRHTTAGVYVRGCCTCVRAWAQSVHGLHHPHTPRQHDVSPQTRDVIQTSKQRAPTTATALAMSWGPSRRQFEARKSRWRHGDGDCKKVSILSFFVWAKIEMDLEYAIPSSYYWNLLGDSISIFNGCLLHSYLSLEISCQYSFNSAFPTPLSLRSAYAVCLNCDQSTQSKSR